MAWYEQGKRDMPWRRTDDPYRIWLSEVMLQQTRVDQAQPYYERFTAAFPTVEALAAADLDAVLRLWEGLGYYSRARNLHKAARLVIDQFEGRFPDTYDAIRTLPGVGAYTAAAVLSIAFGRPHAVLDGNVIRVLTRAFAIADEISGSRTRKQLQTLADTLLDSSKPGDFNQAMMELGATVCLPKKPLCRVCPLQAQCEAQKRGEVEKFPEPRARPGLKKIEVSAAVITRNGKVFIQQRPHSGLMGGLWEFPGGKRQPKETEEECLTREIQEELSIPIAISKKMMTIKHSYTQFRVTLNVFWCPWKSGRIRATQCEQWKWVKYEDLNHYTFPAANAKIVKVLLNGKGTFK